MCSSLLEVTWGLFLGTPSNHCCIEMQASKDTITCTYDIEFPRVVFLHWKWVLLFFSSYKRSAPLVGTQNALVSRWVLKQMEVTQTVLLDWYRVQGEWYLVQKNPCLMKKRMMMIDSVLQPLPVRLRSWLKVTRPRIAQSMSWSLSLLLLLHVLWFICILGKGNYTFFDCS